MGGTQVIPVWALVLVAVEHELAVKHNEHELAVWVSASTDDGITQVKNSIKNCNGICNAANNNVFFRSEVEMSL
mgnify:CR=1 FL=1